MSLLSVRLIPEELIKVKARAYSEGFTSISDYLRHLLGLPKAGPATAAIKEIDAIDGASALKLMVHMQEQLTWVVRGVNRMSRSLGAPVDLNDGWLEMPIAPKENLTGDHTEKSIENSFHVKRLQLPDGFSFGDD